MDQKFKSHSEQETIDFGARFGAGLKAGDVVCLTGPLGSGKTHFVKGLAEGIGLNKSDIQSPTYTLINEHETGELPLYHFDCYRLKSESEAREIGAEEYFFRDGVSVVEWAEKIRGLIPEHAVWVRICIMDRETRKFVITK